MNKYLYSLAVLLCASLAAQAQTQKGSQLLGGQISESTGKGTTIEHDPSDNGATTVSKDKMNYFGIGPSYSYFVANNLDLGASVGYTSSTLKNNFSALGNDATQQKGFNSGVFLRKYFLYDGKVGFRVGPYVSYQHAKATMNYQNTQSFNEDTVENRLNAGIGLDFVYFPARRIGLAASIGSLSYEKVYYKELSGGQLMQEQRDHAFGANLASNLALSVYYSFGK
ncbi:outer membrane beta-barrel protein [Mucilaginibacter robiniae]|uniref:Outer membrane beta-barrel protein n=1 Tax=Mucilaginibacter robiniae TaxID=2728022 RepID=A0A7L5DWY8_9SPHI|nr:outer membrane beta-barrel protein [Mucilaginibacter robiniae]QJD95545.1 outer membrane beta-barrel protein [Mucilaginibacter robiniae]